MYKCSRLFINVLHQRTVYCACACIGLRYAMVFAAQMRRNWTENRGACCTLSDLFRSVKGIIYYLTMVCSHSPICYRVSQPHRILSRFSPGESHSCLGGPASLSHARQIVFLVQDAYVDIYLCLIYGTRVISSISWSLRWYSYPSWCMKI